MIAKPESSKMTFQFLPTFVKYHMPFLALTFMHHRLGIAGSGSLEKNEYVFVISRYKVRGVIFLISCVVFLQ